MAGRSRHRLVPRALVRNVPALAPDRVPTVSVIIPCYNYGRFLPDSVGSAQAQQGVQPEIIIVDDASTDDSAAIAQGFADADPRVRLLRHETNTHHVVAFNDGYALATGEFIVRLDADDILTPGSLARAAALFDAYPSVGLVYGHPRHFVGDPPAPVLGLVRSWSIWSGSDWIGERCRRGYNVITTPEAMIRASVMAGIGGLSRRLRFAQDMEMWLRVAAVSDVGRVNGPDQALHRDHDGSMSVNEGKGHLLDVQERREVFATLFDGPGGQLPRAGEYRALANATLAAEALDEACRAYDRGRLSTVDIEAYVAFAEESCPQARQLPQWRALAVRRRFGPALAQYAPTAVAAVVRRRWQHESRVRRWQRVGL